jgi:hypothetical protein
LKNYIDEFKIEKEIEAEKIKLPPKKVSIRKVDDFHFCVFFWLFILFLVIITSLGSVYDVTQLYSNRLGIKNLIKINSQGNTFSDG